MVAIIFNNIEKKINIINNIKCVNCGCSQQNACVDKLGDPCSWVRINYDKKIGICSACVNKINYFNKNFQV